MDTDMLQRYLGKWYVIIQIAIEVARYVVKITSVVAPVIAKIVIKIIKALSRLSSICFKFPTA